ncbi:MAG: nitroreductase [Cytophagales bacterium]|nr:nitroreductase [Cytophagales bacterium]MDW8384190.1 nitroreductase [Flammeovirgaceae bacterium]
MSLSDAINLVISQRRSYTPDEFDGSSVPKEIIEKALENANWAPTHGLTEPWRFVVFLSEESKQQLSEIHSSLYKEKTPISEYSESKYQKLKQLPLKSSAVVAIIMKRQEAQLIPEIEEIEAVACAVQNFHLTLTAYGYGGYWSSGGATYYEELKQHFGLLPIDKILGFFYIGKPKAQKEGKRKPWQQKVTWL